MKRDKAHSAWALADRKAHNAREERTRGRKPLAFAFSVLLVTLCLSVLGSAAWATPGVPPTTTLSTSPATPDGANGWFKTATTITLTSSDPGLTYYKWNSEAYQLYTAAIPAREGVNTLYFYSVNDTNDTELEQSQAIQVDTAAPTVPALSDPADGAWVASQNPSLSWAAAADSSSGLANYIIRIVGSTDQTVDPATTSAPTTATLTEGAHTWQIIAVDNAGNESTSLTRTVNVDIANPTASISSPLTGATISGNVSIRGTARDANFLNYLLEYGSGGTPASWNLIIDSPTAKPGAGEMLGTLNATTLNAGQYTVRLTVNDLAGKVRTRSVLVNVQGDSICPITTLSTSPVTPDGANGWFKTATTITLTSSEPGTTRYQWDSPDGAWTNYTGSFTAPEGNHTLFYYSYDGLGNTEAMNSQPIKVDRSAPETPPALVDPFDNKRVATTLPTFKWDHAVDASSGVATYKLIVDGVLHGQVGGTVSSMIPTSALTAGLPGHDWCIVAEDAAGNQTTSTATWHLSIDTTNPIARITSPANGSRVSGTIGITGTATDENLFRYTLEYGQGASPSSWTLINEGMVEISDGTLGTLDTSSWLNSTYTIRLTVEDYVGHKRTASTTVNTDNADASAPSTPAGVSAIPLSSSEVHLAWSGATDNIAVTGYKVYDDADDSVVGASMGTDCQVTGLAPSTLHRFYIKAHDAAGNYSDRSANVDVSTYAGPVPVTSAQAGDDVPLGAGITVNFEQVDVVGNSAGTVEVTAITETAPYGALPGKAVPGSFIDIAATNIDFTSGGWITVKVPYDKAKVTNENKLKLLHWNGSGWEEAAGQNIDIQSCTLTGQVQSLSPFVIAEGEPDQIAYGMNTNLLLIVALSMMSIGVCTLGFTRFNVTR